MYKKASRIGQSIAGAGPSLRTLIRLSGAKSPLDSAAPNGLKAKASPKWKPAPEKLVSRSDLTASQKRQGEEGSKRARRARQRVEKGISASLRPVPEPVVMPPGLDEGAVSKVEEKKQTRLRRQYLLLVDVWAGKQSNFSEREAQRQKKELLRILRPYLAR